MHFALWISGIGVYGLFVCIAQADETDTASARLISTTFILTPFRFGIATIDDPRSRSSERNFIIHIGIGQRLGRNFAHRLVATRIEADDLKRRARDVAEAGCWHHGLLQPD